VHIRTLSSADLDLYTSWLSSHPRNTLWQSLGWKAFQESLARQVRIYVVEHEKQIVASALTVIDRTTGGYSAWDIPRGPLWKNPAAITPLLRQIREDAYKEKGLALYLSPLDPLPSLPFPLRKSPRHEQPEASMVVDVSGTEEEILKKMHPKGRYNIKVAEKHGVIVEQSADASTFHRLIAETAGRDGFTPASKKHYFNFLQTIPGSFLLIAYKDHQAIAGLIGVIDGKTGLPAVAEGHKMNEREQPSAKVGIYYYGASSYEHRSSMAPYLLQWEAIKRCKAEGCEYYDLLGIAPPDASKNHPWSGITDFKSKFGGHLVIYPPEQMYMLRPFHYGVLKLKRRILR
jgi:lipid II:glycine glycyltransferase (peptidoglycan interpeptide bridge formation enzyme)